MSKIVLLFLIFTSSLAAQTDWQKWGKKTVDFTIPLKPERKYTFDSETVPVAVVSLLKNTYWFLFSDHDGDNCPFHPTCSQFLMNAVKETNILKGALMFADRFMRDSNFFKSPDHYPLHSSGRFYDPVHNYKLNYSKINYIPSEIIVDNE